MENFFKSTTEAILGVNCFLQYVKIGFISILLFLSLLFRFLIVSNSGEKERVDECVVMSEGPGQGGQMMIKIYFRKQNLFQ